MNTGRDRKEGFKDKAGPRRRDRRGEKNPSRLLTLETIEKDIREITVFNLPYAHRSSNLI